MLFVLAAPLAAATQSCDSNGVCLPVIGLGAACSPFREIAPLAPVCDNGLQCTVFYQSKSKLPGLCLPKSIVGRAQINQKCGGFAGFKCPEGLQCFTPAGLADGLGVCVMA
ncbi:hypothetical protein EDD86DRAFT_215903 [Gorgonomyces haynaldii]|nr:hypothetical protein EDD86DRAFT_215903 [Gorgonomyces haynaldii]